MNTIMHMAGVALMVIGALVIALAGWDIYAQPSHPGLPKYIALGLGVLSFWFGYGPARNTNKESVDDASDN